MNTLVVTNTSQLVTVAERDVQGARGALRAIEDGALAAREGHIVWVGPRAALPAALAAGADVLDAGGRLVIPGFVDAHTHPIFAGLRAMSGEYSQSLKVDYGTKTISADVSGVKPEFGAMRNLIPEMGGRFLDPIDFDMDPGADADVRDAHFELIVGRR